jgi:TrmH family RNA methyltransferase
MLWIPLPVPPLERITSTANPLIKEIRKAGARGTLTPSGHAIAESFHLIEEALRSGSPIWAVLIAESAVANAERVMSRLTDTRVLTVPDLVFDALSTTETSQGVMALVEAGRWSVDQVFGSAASLVVVLDAVQDPGNAGAVVRAAEAFGATGIIFGKGTVSPHNPRTLRASAGSLFRLPYIAGKDPAEVLQLLRERGCTPYAAMPWSAGVLAADEIDLRQPVALIIGNEGAGVNPLYREVAHPIAIRTQGVESLNAAVAAAILMYETSRQRSA